MLTRRHVVAGLGALAAPTIVRAQPRGLRLRRGMNLWPWFSLTREFPSPRTDYDWPPFQANRAIPVRGDLAALRSAGIDFVRLPVDPGPLLAFSGVQRERLFADILGAIELCNDEALTVIVNLHPNGATHHYNPRNLVGDVMAPLFTRYLGLVRDIAVRLAKLDPARVAFEPLNEPPQALRRRRLERDAGRTAAHRAARCA